MTDARSAEIRELARERLVNFDWETKVQALRLQLVEAELAAEGKMADVRTLELQIDRAHIKIATTTLAQMEKTLQQSRSHSRARF